jgi:hypothetical protein
LEIDLLPLVEVIASALDNYFSLLPLKEIIARANDKKLGLLSLRLGSINDYFHLHTSWELVGNDKLGLLPHVAVNSRCHIRRD